MQSLFEMAIGQLGEAQRANEREANAVEHSVAAIESDKRRMLEDPGKLEKAVANMADYYSPTASTKKPKGESYGIDTVEASKSSSDPTIGFGRSLRENFSTALMDPKYRGVSAGRLLQGISSGMMATPDNTGKSLLEKSTQFSRTEDSRWFGGVANKKLPGYDAWKADKQLQEKQKTDKESWLPSVEDLAISTGLGAALGGSAGALGSGLAGAASGAGIGGAAGLALGGPLGGLIGAAGGGIAGFFGGEAVGAGAGALIGGAAGLGGELLAAPIKKLVHKTDWYQGMHESNSKLDNLKAGAADLAAYLPGALMGGKAVDSSVGKMFKNAGSGLEESFVTGLDGKAINGMTGKPLSADEAANLAKPGQQALIGYDPSQTVTPGNGRLLDPNGNPFVSRENVPTWDTVAGEGPVVKALQELRKLIGMEPGGSRATNPAADNAAIDNILTAIAETNKAKADIAAKPTASNIVDVASKKTTVTKDVPGSDLVAKSQELSPDGLKEVGFEPIDPAVDSGIVPLTGSIPDKIKEATARDTFVKTGKEDVSGVNRTAIADNSKKGATTKGNAVGPDVIDAVDAAAKTDQAVATTPVQQKSAIENVTTFSEGGKSVTEEFFPGVKQASTADVKSKYYESLGVKNDTERIAQMREEAISNLKADRSNANDVSPITEEEINKEFNLIKSDETENFRFWADDNRIDLPVEMSKKNYKLIAGMAAFGISAPILYASLSSDPKNEASAGFLTAMIETAAKSGAAMGREAVDKLAQGALAKGLISKGVSTETVMGAENFQRGLIQDSKEVMNTVLGNIRSGSGAGVQYALMSPYQIIESLFTTGKGKVVNAATNLASFVTAGSRTRQNATRVVQNILDEAGIKAVPSQVKQATDYLVPMGAKATKADIAAVQLSQAEGRIAKYQAKIKPNTSPEDVVQFNSDIKVEQDNVARLKGTLEELSGSIKDYHDNWTKTMQELTKEHSSVRVSLALEDPTGELYPWLPKLNRNEEVAVGKLRGLLDQYQVRLKDRGIPTRNNYFPHSPHPEMSKIYNAELNDILGGAPYQKFYSRTDSSRALLPDISYSMNHYLTDIEPRIQNHDFWEKSGWGDVRNSTVVQSNPGLKRAFDSLYEGSKPPEPSWQNTAARRYAEFEAVQKLFLSPSAGLKHLIKMTADIASVGPEIWVKSLPDTAGFIFRKVLDKTWGINGATIRAGLEKLGVRSDRFGKSLINDYMDSAIMSGNIRKYMLDMGIESQDQIFSTAKNLWNKAQDVGSTWINVAELADRATSVSSALQMAAKKGMTVDQAMYGTYDLILKNNFLFGQFNPSWLNNPKIRAFLMFQATPFKIFERRLVTAQRSFANIGQLNDKVKAIVKNPGGWEKVLQDVKNMSAYMKEGQSELKSNLVIDTLRQETDFFGTPIVRQMLTDMMTVGAATYGGAQAGLALSDHFFHIPFLSTQSKGGKAELALSPLASGVMEGYNTWKTRPEDFQLSSVMNKWLGKYGPLPSTIQKAIRLSNNDIPEIYRKGGGNEYLKYLFAIPGKE